MRKRQCGGTRNVDVDRAATKEQLFEIGKELVFPQRESTEGPSTLVSTFFARLLNGLKAAYSIIQ